MSKRVFIVAPNVGLHMGTGGGVKVALAMASVFENQRHEPYLVALRGYDLRKLSKIHGIKLKLAKPLYFLGEGGSLRIPFPMQIRLLVKYLEDAIVRYKPDAMIFNDDVPRIGEELFSKVSSALYSHFPYAARIKFNITDAFEIPVGVKTYLDIWYRKLVRKLIYINHMPSNIVLFSNSWVTKIFMKKLWVRDPVTLHPPLIIPHSVTTLSKACDKREFVTVLATLQPNKRIGEVIKAFSQLRSGSAKLVIAGHRGPAGYMEYIIKLIKQLGIKGRVSLLLDIDEAQKWSILAKSKIIVSAAHFEPFGISVVEGMYANNIPVVYKGPLSGPWIDIIEKGKYGIGFRSVEELTELMDIAIQSYTSIIKDFNPSGRAREFCFERFTERLTNKLISEII